jgi:hypothetical protein
MANIKDKSTPYWNDMGVRAKVMCSTYKSMDKNKNFDISNNIDQPYMLELWKGGCVYCGETDWHKLGCDRIDNSKPHSKDNVVCSCKDCNWIRNANFSFEEMLMIGEAIRKIKEKRCQS